MSLFAVASLAGWSVVVLAARLRSRAYAVFRGVSLLLVALFANALWPRFQWAAPLFVYLYATVFVHSLALVRPRLRPLWYRALISVPAALFSAGTLLALPWVLLGAFGLALPLPWLPYAVAALGVAQSLVSAEEELDIVVADGRAVPALARQPLGQARVARPLRITQISDPHLGPFMSVARLRRICERAVARQPDLVFLTGDFLTMESQADARWLSEALAPLKALSGRCFACFGNHDHEAPEVVARALAENGVCLLVDGAQSVATPAGPVQVLGVDYRFRERKAHLEQVCARHPRELGQLRIVLLHDPGAFVHLPPGQADLVLSGHTHGGQVGLVSLGLPWTMLRVLMNAPDHGLWARGPDRLYVHRGTGHYGFPLRLGVPGEQSLIRVHVPTPVAD